MTSFVTDYIHFKTHKTTIIYKYNDYLGLLASTTSVLICFLGSFF